MVQWLQQVPETTVGDLVAHKRHLIDIHSSSTLAQALDCLRKHNILSVPVYGKVGAWIGSGGVELIVGDKQYIGIVSIVDILSFIFSNAMPLANALSTPITYALGSTDESLCLWVEPSSRPLITACECMCKGVHRALVTFEDSCRLLTQTDIIKFLMTHRAALPHLSQVFSRPVSSFIQRDHKLVTISIDQDITSAIAVLLNSRITAAPVVDIDGKIVTQLSFSDFRSVANAALATVRASTVKEFLSITHNEKLVAPVACKSETPLGDAVQRMLLNKVHRIWVSTAEGWAVVSYTDVIAAAFNAEHGHA